MIKLICLGLAIVLIVIGLIVMPMPIPLGEIIISGGFIPLISVSATAAW